MQVRKSERRPLQFANGKGGRETNYMFTSKIFRWEPIKGGDIVRTPGLQFPIGFHVKIMDKEKQATEKST